MEREEYIDILRQHSYISCIELRMWRYEDCARAALDNPLSSSEQRIAEKMAARRPAAPHLWYHGGIAGLDVGDLLLPPQVTGANPRNRSPDYRMRRDRVYITYNRSGAEHFQRQNGRAGTESRVYVVEPQGELSFDMEAFRTALLLFHDPHAIKTEAATIVHLMARHCCESARVLEVLG